MCDESAASPLIIITTPSCNVALPVYFGHFIFIISVDKNLSEAWRHNHSVCHLLLPPHMWLFKILFSKSYIFLLNLIRILIEYSD